MGIIIALVLSQFWPIHVARDKKAYITVSMGYDNNVFRYSDDIINGIVNGRIGVPIKSLDDFRAAVKTSLLWDIAPSTSLSLSLKSVTYARNTEKGYQVFRISFRKSWLSFSAGYTPYRFLFYGVNSKKPIGYHEYHAEITARADLDPVSIKVKAKAGQMDFENDAFDYVSGPFYSLELEAICGRQFVAVGRRIQKGREPEPFDGFNENSIRAGGRLRLSSSAKLEASGSYRNRRFLSDDPEFQRIDDIYELKLRLRLRLNRRLEIAPFVSVGARRIYRRFTYRPPVGWGMSYNRMLGGIAFDLTI